jgi:YVTN family beta-propeller protein
MGTTAPGSIKRLVDRFDRDRKTCPERRMARQSMWCPASVVMLLVSVALSCGQTQPTPSAAANKPNGSSNPILPAGSIVLPDSMGGVSDPSRLALNPRDGRVYVAGGLGVAVVDAATGKQVDIIPAEDVAEMQYNPIANVLYLWSAPSESWESITVDCGSDSIASRESLALWPTCFNLRDNKLYAAMGKENSSAVAVLDGHTRRLLATVGSAQPSKGNISWRSIVWNPANDRVYYSDGGNAIVVIDGRTNKEVARIPNSAGLEPRCANPRNNKIYASSHHNPDSSLAVIDCWTNRVVAWLPVNVNIADVAYNPVENKVYCSGGGGLYGGMPSVAVIDGKNDRFIKRVVSDSFRNPPSELCYDSMDNRMYCFGFFTGIAAIDCRRDSIIWATNSIAAHRPVFFAPANRLYCVDWRQGDVYVMDGSTFSITDTLTLGYRVKTMLYNGQQDKLYCANGGGHALAVIDCGAGRVRGTIEVGREPDALACTPDGEKLYCTNEANGTISVIDCESDQVIDSIKVGGEPTSLCLSPSSQRLFCAAGSSRYGEKSTISVIDYRTDSVVSKLVVGNYPHIVYDSVKDRVFCTTGANRQLWLSAYNAKTLGRIFSLELQGYRVGMGYDPDLDQMYVARTEPNEVTAIDCRNGITRWVMRTAGPPSKLLYTPRTTQAVRSQLRMDPAPEQPGERQIRSRPEKHRRWHSRSGESKYRKLDCQDQSSCRTDRSALCS